MGATSIHVQAVKPGSEIHNFREKELDYVRPELSHLNESWVGDSISHRLESAKQVVLFLLLVSSLSAYLLQRYLSKDISPE